MAQNQPDYAQVVCAECNPDADFAVTLHCQLGNDSVKPDPCDRQSGMLGIEGTSLIVQGLDGVDGTPVLDLKGYMKGFEPYGKIHELEGAAEMMAVYW